MHSKKKPDNVGHANMPRVKEDGLLRAVVGLQIWGEGWRGRERER